jgi:Protein of unknown function (DUF4019)
MRPFLSAVLAVVLLSTAAPLASEESPEKAAEAAAGSWLALVDAGKYGESWDAAASAFRDSVTRAQWEEALERVRTPFGKVVSRNLKSAKYAKEEGSKAPAGDYVILQFDTSFEKRPSSIETVTLMKEKDGSWKVAGYFIR